MSPLNHKAECKTKDLYRVWKGQLFIQGQQVCDIALRSPSSGSNPAELPAKLESRYAIEVSELRKKLPEAAFTSCAGDKVCHQGILFSFYDVEIPEDVKVHQLIKSLKEKDLALVKYLNDQGIFILLASSALLEGKVSGPEESSSCLQAIFLTSSQNLMGLTANDLQCTPEQHERASQVTSVLPGLRHALAEAAKCPDSEGSPPGSVVERYIRDFATLGQDSRPPIGQLDSLPNSFDLFLKRSDLEAVSEKCPPGSFSRLQFYLSDPRNYSLDLATTVACFGDRSRSPSSGRVCDAERATCLNSDSLPPDGVKLAGSPQAGSPQAAQSDQCSKSCSLKTGHTSDWTLQRSKRKSSRLLGAASRNKWVPLKVFCNMESCVKQTKAKKKKTTLSTPSSKIPEPRTDSNEPTLKLKHLQCPLGGKRGAEVLSAEFVQRPRCELATSESPEQKRPGLLKHTKHLDANKVTSEEKTKKKKRPIKKRILRNAAVTPLESQREAGNENNPSDGRAATQDVGQTLRKDQYDSHALNMLADLALGSVNSVVNNHGSPPVLPCSSSGEPCRPQKGKALHKVSDHEYHRVAKKRKVASLSVQTRAESPSSSQGRGRVNYNQRRRVRSGLTTPHVGLPKQAADVSDPSAPSLISSEHSYASPLQECSERLLLLKGVHSLLSSKNGVKRPKSGPLLGKVLPFRHQQNLCRPHRPFKSDIPSVRFAIMAARWKEDFSESHKVSCCDEAVKVTCRWEAEYLFSLDSKYTNNSLEKTVVRAVHGPWDDSITDDTEEVKLILHTWIGLFYSKTFRSPTARNVVEHSNPAKFVSLNSVPDPLGLLDDHGGVCSLEKCPADSLSDVDKPCAVVEETARPSSEKPLSCNELSSTSCVENEEPSPEETSRDDQVDTTTSNSEATMYSPDQVTGEDADNSLVPDPVVSVNSLNSISSELRLDECLGSQVLITDEEAQANPGVNFAEVSQSDLASAPPADSADEHPAAASAESQEIDSGPCEAEEECLPQTSAVRSPNAEESWLEASAAFGGDDGPGRDAGNLAVDEERDGDGDGDDVDVVELDSLVLVLSESNEDDLEHRDLDLDDENEGLSERSCVTEANLLPTCELHPAQNSLPTQEEARAFPVLAQQLMPLDHLGLDEGVSIPREEEGCHLTETAHSQASELDKVQSIAAAQEQQPPRQAQELQDSSTGTKEKQSLGLNRLVPESKPEDEDTGDLPVPREVGCGDDELNQIADTLPEAVMSLLYDLIDRVSAVIVVREETCSEEKPAFNWLGSVALESITSSESDEESCSTDPQVMANEHLKQNCSCVGPTTDSQGPLQGQGWRQSTQHESASSDQANLVESESEECGPANLVESESGECGSANLVESESGECGSGNLVQENEAASSSSGYMDWARTGTRSLESSPPFAETALSTGKGSSASVVTDLALADSKASISESDKVKEACGEIVPCVSAEHHSACSSEESDLSACVDAGESLGPGDFENAFGEQLARESAQLPTRAMDADVHLEDPLSSEDDEELFGIVCPRSLSGTSCCMTPTDLPGAAGTDYVCDLNPEEELCGDGMHLENKRRGSGVETRQYDGPLAVRKGDRSVSPALDIDSNLGQLTWKGDRSVSPALDIDSNLGQLTYINFSITKKHKDKTRTFNSSKRCDTCVGESRLINNSLSRPWRVLDDPIRITLDMECVRFHCKLKETLTRNALQLSTSSALFDKNCSPRVRAEREAAASAPGPPARSQSPLMVTISKPRPRQRVSGSYPRIGAHRANPDAPAPPPAASRGLSQGRKPFSPFRPNRFTYDAKLSNPQGDLVGGFAESSRVTKLRQTSRKERYPSSTSESAPAPEKGCSSLPRRMASYETLFAEQSNIVRFKLKCLAKEACKKPYVFYLVETDGDPFFGRLKNLLKKRGHTEAEPLHFLKASSPETDSLKVIIRNEDISSHVYKIPSLLRLKHLPNVTFVGVDSPEDALNDTCQELFHSGGFVVSDVNMLRAMTVEALKDTVKTLEKLNGHGRWRWLLHYKETKQLRQEARLDSAAHAKDLILRSCQGTNIMEVLHYHQCDSKSVPRSEHLKCLLNLQAQHVQRRFAVFLTEKPRAKREALESKGILVLHVNTFIRTAQDVAAPFQSGC